MKKLLAILCCAAMLFVALASILTVSAAPTDGVSFSQNDLYYVKGHFEARPNTVEAWIHLPTSYTGRGGMILSNYASLSMAMSFEILENGKPRFYVKDADMETVHDYVFKNADVRSDGWTHLAIVIDEPARKLYCYINGRLADTKNMDAPIDDESWAPLYRLGGDQRINNDYYFKGRIKSVSVYSETRSATQIAADYQSLNLSDPALMAHYDLNRIVNDEISDNVSGKYNIGRGYHWIDAEDKAPVTDYAYSFCFVGDPQKILEQEPEKFHYIYDWIVANAEDKKMQYVFGLGDITHTDTDAEWALSKAQIERLNGLVPYSVIRGNHDGSKKFNSYLGTAAYKAQFEGFYSSNKIENSWRTLRVGETDWLLVTLDYAPSDEVLAWASDVIESHPDHKVIITTHGYLRRDGARIPTDYGQNANNGSQIWDKLASKHGNIQMVISGHEIAAEVLRRQSIGDCGNVVTELMINPQWADNKDNVGATGMVTMLYFSEDGRSVTVETYSTIREQYHLSNNQFTFTPDEYEILPPVSVESAYTPPVKLPDGSDYDATPMFGSGFVWSYLEGEHNRQSISAVSASTSTGLMFMVDTTHSVAGEDPLGLLIRLGTDLDVNGTDPLIAGGYDVKDLSLTPKPAFAEATDKTSTWYISRDGATWTPLKTTYRSGTYANLGGARGKFYVYVPLANGYFCTATDNIKGTGAADGDGDGAATNSYLDALSKTGGFCIDSISVSMLNTAHGKDVKITNFHLVNGLTSVPPLDPTPPAVDENPPAADEGKKNDGCGSVVSSAALVVLATLGMGVTVIGRKKH